MAGRATFIAAMLAGPRAPRRDPASTSARSSAAISCRSSSARPGWPSSTRRPPGGILNVGSGVALPIGRLALWLIEGYGRGRLTIDSPDERDSLRARHAQPEGPARRCRLQRERPAGELHRHRSQATPLTGRSARAWTSTGFQNKRLINCPITRPAAAGGTGDAHGLDHGLKRTALARHATADPERHQ